MHGMENVKFES